MGEIVEGMLRGIVDWYRLVSAWSRVWVTQYLSVGEHGL